MTKANMMREAHKLAKTFEGDYTACLSLALRTLNRGVVRMTELEAVEMFLAENKNIEFGKKGKVLVITQEIAEDMKKFFKGEFNGSLTEIAIKNGVARRGINTLDEAISSFVFEKCGSAFSKMVL